MNDTPRSPIPTSPSLRPGIAVLLAQRHHLLANKRVGVLSNSSGVLPDFTSSVDALILAADVRAIFIPEHGVPMTEDTPPNATSRKGRLRAELTWGYLQAQRAGKVRVAIGRAADFLDHAFSTRR